MNDVERDSNKHEIVPSPRRDLARRSDALAARTLRDLRRFAPLDLPPTLTLDCGGGVLMEVVLIPAGIFTMGSNDGNPDEQPPHEVIVSEPFYIGRYQVTQAEWQAVMGYNPSYFSNNGAGKDTVAGTDTSGYPVEMISWDDCQEFCKKLSERTGEEVRLPTEAEWEYACRAGSMAKYCFGDDESRLREYAWLYDDNSESKTRAVGAKRPNAWGLYDMHGNVCEWCADWYDQYEQRIPQTYPMDVPRSKFRVLRGGSIYDLFPEDCRCAHRARTEPNRRLEALGVRIAVAGRPGSQASLPSIIALRGAIERPRWEAFAPMTPEQAHDVQAAAGAHLGLAPRQTFDLGGGVKMELVLIPAGKFVMGSNDGAENEKPPHEVTINTAFYLGKNQVTQAQWRAVMGSNPSHFKGNDLPVDRVSWLDCGDFYMKLSKKAGKQVRLPTEAEWEYACRAGTITKYSFGDDDSLLGEYAWFSDNTGGIDPQFLDDYVSSWGHLPDTVGGIDPESLNDYVIIGANLVVNEGAKTAKIFVDKMIEKFEDLGETDVEKIRPLLDDIYGCARDYVNTEGVPGKYYGMTRPVGRKKPNAWGLYDMHGNVREWCANCYLRYAGSNAGSHLFGQTMVLRGGCWAMTPMCCRSAYRDSLWFDKGSTFDGLRVAVSAV